MSAPPPETLIKRDGESRLYAIDFANLLTTSESLDSVTSVTPSPAGPTIADEAISGTEVQFRVTGGTAETVYRISAIAVTDDGNTLEGIGDLEVVA